MILPTRSSVDRRPSALTLPIDLVQDQASADWAAVTFAPPRGASPTLCEARQYPVVEIGSTPQVVQRYVQGHRGADRRSRNACRDLTGLLPSGWMRFRPPVAAPLRRYPQALQRSKRARHGTLRYR